MEHSIGTTPRPTSANLRGGDADTTALIAERRARAEWLITELGRLAAHAEDPHDQVRYRRTADSLVRLATAFRS